MLFKPLFISIQQHALRMSFTIDSIALIILLLALTVAPGIAVAVYVHWRDKFDREPRRLLVRSFFMGMLAVIPPVLLHIFCDIIGFKPREDIFTMMFYAFIVIALSEELSKFALLRWYAYPKPEFNEPFDGITYSVMIAMGFATLENIFYVLDGDVHRGLEVALLRMVTAVPAHACDGIIMGYYLGLAKFRHDGQPLQFTAVICAVIAHGFYDFFIFVEQIGLLAIGAFIVLAIAIYLSFKAMHIHQQNSPFRKTSVVQ